MNKENWDYFTHIWKTESAYLSWVRGNIRNIWKKSPQRSEFLKSKLERHPVLDKEGNPICFKNGKVKLYNAYSCAYCSLICYDKDKIGNRKTYAVDHIIGNHSLTSFDMTSSFFEAMLKVRLEDLQILCNECHDIKSYAESRHMSLEEALFFKKAILITNNKQDKNFFLERNLPVPKNKELRRQCIISILKEEVNNLKEK